MPLFAARYPAGHLCRHHFVVVPTTALFALVFCFLRLHESLKGEWNLVRKRSPLNLRYSFKFLPKRDGNPEAILWGFFFFHILYTTKKVIVCQYISLAYFVLQKITKYYALVFNKITGWDHSVGTFSGEEYILELAVCRRGLILIAGSIGLTDSESNYTVLAEVPWELSGFGEQKWGDGVALLTRVVVSAALSVSWRLGTSVLCFRKRVSTFWDHP